MKRFFNVISSAVLVMALFAGCEHSASDNSLALLGLSGGGASSGAGVTSGSGDSTSSS